MSFAACAPAPAQEPALWRIADEDSEIWLFGTVHVLPESIRWRGARVNAAFAAADEFITETDTSPASVQSFQALALQHGALPAGQTLFDMLGADDRARLERVARQATLQPQSFERTRPWLAALQLSYFHAAQRGHTQEAGVETVLSAEARTGNKRISFFETPEEQVRILADLAPEDELRFLVATLREIEEEADRLDELDRAWARGDVTELGRQLDTQLQEAGPAVHEALIVRRNRAWADEIARRLEGSGRIFVAVGAAHLVGEGSVVALLRERGIEVEGP